MREIRFPRFIDEYSGEISSEPSGFLSPIEVPEPWIGVYTGTGASHSFIWVFDTFERAGIFTVYPFDEMEIEEIDKFNLLFISGGDTVAVAGGLGERGADSIKRFLNNGGIYFGSCAGAYLLLHSSKHPLNLFNFIRIPVANIMRELPPIKDMPHKAFNPYGCCFLIHAVRGELLLETTEFPPSFKRMHIKAPLFGGPVFTEPERATVLARYVGFTERTQFLYDEKIAEDLIPGKVAVVGVHLGRGFAFLSGPHLEHPSYHQANLFMFKIMAYALGKFSHAVREPHFFEGECEVEIPLTVRRLISDIMRETLRMGDLSAFWKVGEKVYMPEHILAFARGLHKRINRLKGIVSVRKGEIEGLENNLRTAYNYIVKGIVEENAGEALSALKSSIRFLLRIYMRNMRKRYGGIRDTVVG